MTKTPEIIDNFLPWEVFSNFAYAAMNSPHFSTADYTSSPMESDGSMETFGKQLSTNQNLAECMAQAILYRRHINDQQLSDFYIRYEWIVQLIKEKLDIKKLYMLRLNCTFGQKERHQGIYHTDMRGDYYDEHCKIAILYLNSNNGGTQFEDGPFVQSEANRIVIAPSKLMHAGVWQTNAKCRYVLNINYEPK